MSGGPGAAMGGEVVWLASFPKSGNTWMRAIVTALATHPHLFAVNKLGSGAQPHATGGALDRFGLDARWLDRSELDALRPALIAAEASDPDNRAGGDDTTPQLRKTHEHWRPGSPGAEPFPSGATRAAIVIVRDPRDVACSYAPFFGLDIDSAINEMATGRPHGKTSPATLATESPWGDWSTHTRSWLDPAVPFPIHVVRFEDLKVDAVGTLAPVFAAIGVACTTEQLAAAVDQARFDRLAASEATSGFRETSPATTTFFRQGRSGAWRDDLTAEQVAAIEADHGDVMTQLGYELITPTAARQALAEARASRRRQGDRQTLTLPAHLGLTATLGDVPDELPDAKQPWPWLQVTERAVRVDFRNHRALLVEDGTTVTVQWDLAPGDDPASLSWVIEGWAVTLSALQRGQLTIHASTVAVGEVTVALAGHKGAGKSTTAMGMRSRGHNLLVDDTTVLEFVDGKAWTTPFARNVHLLPDAAAALGVDFDALAGLAGRPDKSSFRPEPADISPRRVDAVVVLAPGDTGTGDTGTGTGAGDTGAAVTCTPVTGATKVPLLRQHVSRHGISEMLLGPTRLFHQLTQLADACDVWLLRRPKGHWNLDDVLDAIENAIEHSCQDSASNPATDSASTNSLTSRRT